jgi:hypothetical protein
VVAFASFELKQPLRVCNMKGTSHRASGIAEVQRVMFCKVVKESQHTSVQLNVLLQWLGSY